MSERSLDSCLLFSRRRRGHGGDQETQTLDGERLRTVSRKDRAQPQRDMHFEGALTGSSQPPVISRNASARSPRRSRTAETVEASAGVTSTRWRRSVEEAISFSVSRLPNMVTLPQLPDFLGAARVRLTDLQEHLALEGDELCFLQPPAHQKSRQFLAM